MDDAKGAEHVESFVSINNGVESADFNFGTDDTMNLDGGFVR